MDQAVSNMNHNTIKTRFAIKFVEAMKRLKKSRVVLPWAWMSMREKYKRYRAVRAAACASMARAVGPDRAWSRAVLRKMRNQRARHLHTMMMMSGSKTRKRRRLGRRNPRNNNRRRRVLQEQEEDLRGLVPGGRRMELCTLLTETAHYINCLQTQVQVMTDILHRYSTT